MELERLKKALQELVKEIESNNCVEANSVTTILKLQDSGKGEIKVTFVIK